MSKALPYFLLLFIILASCKQIPEDKNSVPIPIPPKPPTIEIKWLTENPIKIKTESHLSYIKGFECDSVIRIDYIGFSGEDFYFPINEKGQYISTIKQTRKLNQNQISRLNSIIGNKKTYENPNIAGCYEPRLAFIYFKNNTVICQTQICLSCNQLHSSAHIANGADGNLNKEAVKKLTELHDELGFKEN